MYANSGVLNQRGLQDAGAVQKDLADLAAANRTRTPSLADNAAGSFTELIAAAERAHKDCARALEDATMRKAVADDEINRMTQLVRVAESFLRTLREGPAQ